MFSCRKLILLSGLSLAVGLGSQSFGDILVEDDLGASQVVNGWQALNNEASAGAGNGFYGGGTYQYPNAGGTGEDPLAVVRELSPSEQFELEDYTGLALEWGDFGGAGGTRFALNVEGVWYFSNNNFIGNTDGTRDSIAFSSTASDWTAFSVGAVDSPDEVLIGGLAASDLSGTVQGYGLFDQASDGDGGHDYDYIAITGTVIPEPASLALLGMGSIALYSRRKPRQ